MPKQPFIPTPADIALGRVLRGEIVTADLTVEQAAAMIGTSRSALQRYLNAEREIPYSVISGIAKIARTSGHGLVMRAEELERRDAARSTHNIPLPQDAWKLAASDGGPREIDNHDADMDAAGEESQDPDSH